MIADKEHLFEKSQWHAREVDLLARLTAAESERDAARKAFADIGWPDPAGRIDYLETNGEEAMETIARLTEERDAALVECEELREALRVLADRADEFNDGGGLDVVLSDTRALLARPATVATARAREALAALEHCEAKSGPGGNVARCIDTWQAYRAARLAAEKEAADAAK